ncbi:DUF4241 domain-containing protein [Actinosynnema sp. NPDC059335]|uniref:DUF4241 domain-containing protein n=1 Tax=Actinosynnema sp. NPDC059335 TaxID=3346804 RepID=UPI003672ED31
MHRTISDATAEAAADRPLPAVPRHADLVFRAGVRWELPRPGAVVTEVREAGAVRLGSGRLVVADPGHLDSEAEPFTVGVEPGEYPVEVAPARFADDPEHLRVAAARLVVTREPAVSWELAVVAGQDVADLGEDEFYGFGVDTGTACFVDADAAAALGAWLDDNHDTAYDGVFEAHAAPMRDPSTGHGLVAFTSGWGDGSYPTWIGRAADGGVTCFVVDTFVLHGATPRP